MTLAAPGDLHVQLPNPGCWHKTRLDSDPLHRTSKDNNKCMMYATPQEAKGLACHGSRKRAVSRRLRALIPRFIDARLSLPIPQLTAHDPRVLRAPPIGTHATPATVRGEHFDVAEMRRRFAAQSHAEIPSLVPLELVGIGNAIATRHADVVLVRTSMTSRVRTSGEARLVASTGDARHPNRSDAGTEPGTANRFDCRAKAQLTTDDVCVGEIEVDVAHGAPLSVDEHFDASGAFFGSANSHAATRFDVFRNGVDDHRRRREDGEDDDVCYAIAVDAIHLKRNPMHGQVVLRRIIKEISYHLRSLLFALLPSAAVCPVLTLYLSYLTKWSNNFKSE